MPYLLSLFIFAKCVMQGGDITSDITGQFHDLVLRVQYLHGLCVGVVANRKRPGNLGSKFPRSKYFERTTTSTTTINTIMVVVVVVVVIMKPRPHFFREKPWDEVGDDDVDDDDDDADVDDDDNKKVTPGGVYCT